ncbi:Interferon-induced GTP-binding protein [Sphaerulina musiva]
MPNDTIHKPASEDVDEVAEMLATASLDGLQSKEYRQILDMVDRLRTCGLGSILPLPQLVVCGNQSSGKSSVLEAITEVPFPRKENLCTRFATEIILRRDQTESIYTKIIPDSARPEAEKIKLSAFSGSISDFTELPDLIETATDLMGLNAASNGSQDQNSPRAFSRDVLSVEIAGPERPQLTLVDLPGLILSATKDQTEADVKLIHSLVGDYIKEKRTIMLAVISAKDDYANQGILTKCKEVDKDGKRTLGIISKPDYLRPGSANEKTWINLAQNNDIYFELGWHMLKNRADDEMDASFEARNWSERAFFSTGGYRELPESDKGVSSLRTKLSKLLSKHLKKELPNLLGELKAKQAHTIAALDALGEKRSTVAEQKRFLMGIATSYQAIVSSAVDGHYEHTFFGPIDIDNSVEDLSNLRRLRAAVQYLNLQFASQMRQYGHKYRIWSTESTAGTNSPNDLPEPDLIEDYAAVKDLQETRLRDEAVDWVKQILVRTRGRELAGNFNPLLMSQLFREQSENWEAFAAYHIDKIATLCAAVVKAAIDEVVSEDLSAKLQGERVDPTMRQRQANAKAELHQLIQDKLRQPITYDPSYTAHVQEARAQKTMARIRALMDQAKVEVDVEDDIGGGRTGQPAGLLQGQVRYFITAVTDQVIERHLLHNLAQDTLSPLMINDMADREVEYFAAEAEDVTHKRAHLEGHKIILEKGQKAFRDAMGSY